MGLYAKVRELCRDRLPQSCETDPHPSLKLNMEPDKIMIIYYIPIFGYVQKKRLATIFSYKSYFEIMMHQRSLESSPTFQTRLFVATLQYTNIACWKITHLVR